MQIEKKQVEEFLAPVVQEVKMAVVKYVVRDVDMTVWIILGLVLGFFILWTIALYNWQRVIEKRNKKLETELKMADVDRKREILILEEWGGALSKEVVDLSDQVAVYREDKEATNDLLVAGHRSEIAGLRKKFLMTSDKYAMEVDLVKRNMGVSERRLTSAQKTVTRLEKDQQGSSLQLAQIKDILANEKMRSAAKASMITSIVNPVEVEDDDEDMDYTIDAGSDKEVDRKRRKMEAGKALMMGGPVFTRTTRATKIGSC
jgi:hypothetical protein